MDKALEAGYMRDLQLLCVGYGLNKETRKQLLGELPHGICCDEVERLIACFRVGDPSTLIAWLQARHCRVENGKEIITCITDRINEITRQNELRKVMARVKFAADHDHCKPEEIITELKEAIVKLEAM